MKNLKSLVAALMIVMSFMVLLVACDNSGSSCVHEYGGWRVTLDPTCSKEGKETRTCQKCGDKETRSIAANSEHKSMLQNPAKPATCSTAGSTEERICVYCRKTLVEPEVIPALGHEEVVDAAQSASCTIDGLTEGKHCSRCNKVIVAQQVIPASGHTVVVDLEGKEPTCIENGLTEQTHCSVCQTVLSTQTVIIASHDKVVDEEGKPATCTDAGWSETSHCSVCNIVLSEKKKIDAIGHIEAVDLAQEPTCTETGLTEGQHCSVCGYVLVKQNPIPATGHTVVVDAAIPATCTMTGLTAGSHCSTCNVTLVEQKVVETTSTHTYVADTCKYCGAIDPDYVPTFSAGEKWVVDGEFEFTINSIASHYVCANGHQAFSDIYSTTAIIINYTYKNLSSKKLVFNKWNFDVYDANGAEGDPIFFANVCKHGLEAKSCIYGGSYTAKLPVVLVNDFC